MNFTFLKNKTFWILAVIILIGAFFRLYNSYNGLRFWADEARDLSMAKQISKAFSTYDLGSLPTRGPDAAKYPNEYGIPVHHGAFYWYLITPAALLSNFHPYGPTFFVIVLNIISIFLIFLAGEKLFDKETGVLASLLFAVSTFAVWSGRYSWNPNAIVFFVLLSLVSFLVIRESKTSYWPLFGLSVSAITQVHIFGYLFVGLVFLIPLFLLRIALPKGKILFFTVLAFCLPIIPEIFSQGFSGVPLTSTGVKTVLGGLFVHTQTFFANFHSIALFILAELMGFNQGPYQTIFAKSIVLIFLFTVFLIILARIFSYFFLLKKFSRRDFVIANTFSFLKTVFSTHRYKIALFTLWIIAAFLIVFLFYGHYGRFHAPYVFLFALPLILLLFAHILKIGFSRIWPFPFSAVLLGIFLFVNMSHTILIMRTPPVTLKDIRHIVQLIQKDIRQPYEIKFFGAGQDATALIYMFQRSTFPPERISINTQERQIVLPLGDKATNMRYEVVDYILDLREIRKDACPSRNLKGSFGVLRLYRCITT